ncbi:MAG: hypothetical protein QW035_00775 [Candidatus Anstonellales archaeon]
MNYESLLKLYNSISKNRLPYSKPGFSESERIEPIIKASESNLEEIFANYSKIKKVQEIKKRFGIKQEKVSVEATKKLEEKMKETFEKKEIEKKEEVKKPEVKEEKTAERPDFEAPQEIKMPEPQRPKEEPKAQVHLTINFSPNIIFPIDLSNPEARAEEHIKEIYSKAKMKVDESDIKKKMFDYTKQLFKTKDTAERERIKAEIVALKNILAGGTAKTNLPALLISHQNFEINNALNSIEKEFERNHGELVRQTKETLTRALSDSDVLSVRREFQNNLLALISEISKVAEASGNYFTVHHFNETRIAKEKYGIDGALDSQETAIMRYKNTFGDFVTSLKERGDERSRGMF